MNPRCPAPWPCLMLGSIPFFIQVLLADVEGELEPAQDVRCLNKLRRRPASCQSEEKLGSVHLDVKALIQVSVQHSRSVMSDSLIP